MLGGSMFILMWTWSRGSAILNAKTYLDNIPMPDLIRMLEKSKPVRVPGTAVFLTNDPTFSAVFPDAQSQAQQGGCTNGSCS